MEPQRLNYRATETDAFKAMIQLTAQAATSGIETKILELVRLRASQINGCAYCIDMHTKDARAAGETEQRLYLLSAWREAPCYDKRERAALAWTEAVTLVADSRVCDKVYDQARAAFSEKELVGLTYAVIAINGWNRLAISFRTEAGGYKPGQHG